ncbi:tyrosine-type recombinase/integrase [bacterium]
MYQYKLDVLTDEEAISMVNACKTPTEKFIVFTILDTGLRVSELIGLKKKSIQWRKKRIVVHGKSGKFKSKTKIRIIPMTEKVNNLFYAWFALRDDISFGKRNVQLHVKKVAKRAGVNKKVTPHVLRHTFAVKCIKQGMSTQELKEILGHDHLETTEIYLTMKPEVELAAPVSS